MIVKVFINKHFIILSILLIVSQCIEAQTTSKISDTIPKSIIQDYTNIHPGYTYQFTKPTFWSMFKYIPKDVYNFGVYTVKKENIGIDALVLGSTIATIPFDQQILEEAGRFGNKLGGWDKDPSYSKLFGVFSIIPDNIPSAVYYVGNGGTTLLLSGIFYGIGKLNNNDLRALNTSSELVECLISVGVTTQTIKRITGRQSPSAAIRDGNPGGDWNPFPSFAAFQSNTPNYDAMPSGHMATFMATITIIGTNYPEIKWIKPVGYSMAGLLAFSMVSTKVHWASDYPIGIFIGYVMGKQIANRRIHKIPKNKVGIITPTKNHYKINYETSRILNTTLLGVSLNF